MTDIEPRSSEDGPAPTEGGSRVNRRGLLGGLALGTVAVGAGAVGAVVAHSGSGSSFRSKRLIIEVACLGETWSESVRSNAANDADFRGAFVVEGWIYPEGTIKGDGFIPREEGSIGRWVCRGAVLVDASRQAPHASVNTGYHFGKLTKDHPFPRTSLHALGLEGTEDRSQIAWRSVVGGTGAYMGAFGEMSERLIATNTSVFSVGDRQPGPCFRNEFELRIPG